jgi:hypothetical protein
MHKKSYGTNGNFFFFFIYLFDITFNVIWASKLKNVRL